MFWYAIGFNQPIGNWNVSSVLGMGSMFNGASSFNQPIGNWNVSNVALMVYMFSDASTFNQPIGNWNVGKAMAMEGIFSNAKVFKQDIGDWDVSRVHNMKAMFKNNIEMQEKYGENGEFFTSLLVKEKEEVLKGYRTILNINVENKFNNKTLKIAVKEWCKNAKKAEVKYDHISIWDVSNVTTMEEMFQDAKSFNQPIGDWDVSNVTDMGAMFQDAQSFNQPIGDWDVNNVTDMGAMFDGAKSFNQPIGDWDVSCVTDMNDMFTNTKTFNQHIGDWDVSNVTNMIEMFSNAKAFNQPIGDWNVSSVTNMAKMFIHAEAFNHHIGDWDVSNVTDMVNMLFSKTFKQDISNWNLSNGATMTNIFSDSDHEMIEKYRKEIVKINKGLKDGSVGLMDPIEKYKNKSDLDFSLFTFIKNPLELSNKKFNDLKNGKVKKVLIEISVHNYGLFQISGNSKDKFDTEEINPLGSGVFYNHNGMGHLRGLEQMNNFYGGFWDENKIIREGWFSITQHQEVSVDWFYEVLKIKKELEKKGEIDELDEGFHSFFKFLKLLWEDCYAFGDQIGLVIEDGGAFSAEEIGLIHRGVTLDDGSTSAAASEETNDDLDERVYFEYATTSKKK
jgi:surface protein